tara:strand:- start:37364 stop:37639 length:276 start_codon:yes stop_codon:yes gene_type:complete
MKQFEELNVMGKFIEELQQRSTERCLECSESDSEMLDKAADELKQARKLIQDLFMKVKTDHDDRMDQHNCYSWAEHNPKLMERLKPYMVKS